MSRACAGLNSGSQASQVYRAVKLAGVLGIGCAALCRLFPDRTARSVENHLFRLRNGQFIAHDRTAHTYRVDDTCLVPVARVGRPASRRAELLALIADCEAGVSAAVLRAEAHMSEKQLQRHLAADLAQGTVVRVQMPASHGGGVGFKMAAAVAAGDAASALVAAELGVRGQFELTEAGQFIIGWGSFEVKLPRDVTRAMFRHLDQLGGLHIEQRLPGGEGGAA